MGHAGHQSFTKGGVWHISRGGGSGARRTYDEAAATPALDGATHVYVQRGGVGPPLADNYAGPYLVLEKGPKVFKLQLGTRQEVVSRDRLKPHLGLAQLAAADPPRRGRPPGRRD